MKQKIAVVGAGIAGISFARLANDMADITVFERRNKIGGLIQCDEVDGYLYHKVGGHIFNAKNQKVLDWFWNFFDKDAEFTYARRAAKVWLGGKLIGYPIENYLFELDKNIVSTIVGELLNKSADFEPANFKEFLQQNFGATLYDLYFKPYNEKIWNADLSKVPLDWLDGKLPMPNLHQIMMSNIFRKEETEMVHAHFYYPQKGGSQFIIDRLAHGINCKTDFSVESIRITAGKEIYINDNGPYNKLIYTGDVRNLVGLISKPNEEITGEIAKLSQLRSNGTTTALCKCDKNDLSWLYLPEKKYKAHRIIYTGNFSANNNAPGERSSCTVEFSNRVDEDVVRAEIKKLPGNLEFLAYHYEPNSYIMHAKHTRQVLGDLKKVLNKNNIYLLGRFAQWEYYNMDKIIESAFVLKDEIFCK